MKNRASRVMRRAVLATGLVVLCFGSVWADIPASAYVQDGLIAQWDGIENAGAGTHDPNAATWKNLKQGSVDFPLPSGCTVGDDSVTIPAKTKVTTSTSVFPSDTPNAHAGTYECYWATPAIPTSGSYGATVLFISDMSFLYRVDKDKFQGTALMSDGKFYRHNFSYTATEQRSFHTVSYATMGTTAADNAFYLDGASRSGTVSGNGETMAQTARTGLVHHDTAAYPVIYKAARIYNRKLTPEEIALNAVIDKLRFGGQDDRYRYNDETGKLEISVTAECQGVSGSTVSLNGGTAAKSASCWVEYGSTLFIAVAPAAGTSLIKWEGGTPTSGGTSGTFTIKVTEPLSLKAVCGKNEKTWNGVEGDLWSDGSKWSPTGVPEEGDLAVIPAGKNVTVDDSTVKLAFLDVSGTVVCSGWTTCVEAGGVAVRNGGKVTSVGPVTTEEDMSRVYLKAVDVTVERGGSVDVTGKGWKCADADNAYGYGPGAMRVSGAMAGGSHGGLGSYVDGSERCAAAAKLLYGSASAPETAGSGGNTKGSLGHGGGVIRIEATGCVTVCGKLLADGAYGSYAAGGGSGAGGSVYVTCRTFAGANGVVRARGGNSSHSHSSNYHSGGGGRVAIVFDPAEQAKLAVPKGMDYSADAGFFAGPSPASWTMPMPGTLYFSSDALIDPAGASLSGKLDFADVTDTWTVESFRLTNGWAMLARDGVKMHVTGDFEVTGPSPEVRRCTSAGTEVMSDDTGGTRWDVGGASLFCLTNRFCSYQSSSTVPFLTVDGDFKVSSNGIVQVFAARDPLVADATEPALTNLGAKVTVGGAIRLVAKGKVYSVSNPYTGVSPAIHAASLDVDAQSFVSADDYGFVGGSNNNAYPGVNKYSMAPAWPTSRNGAGHGGRGGWCTESTDEAKIGPVYDDMAYPLLPGVGAQSIGYSSAYGPRGGGAIRLFVTGDAVVDGTLKAGVNESQKFCGGSSGGSVLLVCRTLTGAGRITATGGVGGIENATTKNSYNGGAGGGGRIAVHYDASAQPAACGITFLANGGTGLKDGTLTGTGDPGTLWFTDEKLVAGNTVFAHKGKIYCPDPLANLTMSALTLENGLIELAPGGCVDVAGDVTIRGTSVSGCGLNIPEGWFRCGGNLSIETGTFTLTGGATPRTERFTVGGDVKLSNARTSISYAETDYGATLTIGGTLSLTNATELTLQSPCNPVEGVPGLTVSANRLVLYKGDWIYPYSHYTNGASCFFRIPYVQLAAGGGINAESTGWGRTTSSPKTAYGPNSTPTDGRAVEGAGASNAVGAGHGGEGGLARQPDKTYARGRGLKYDSAKRPVLPGCGGGNSYNDNIPARGGGVIRFESQKFDLNGGSLLAGAKKPASKFCSGASGGSIYLRAWRFIGGGGVLKANGGNGSEAGGDSKTGWSMAAGGGGRIAVWAGNYGEPEVTNCTLNVDAGLVDPTLEPVDPTAYAARQAKDGTKDFYPIAGLRVLVR